MLRSSLEHLEQRLNMSVIGFVVLQLRVTGTKMTKIHKPKDRNALRPNFKFETNSYGDEGAC